MEFIVLLLGILPVLSLALTYFFKISFGALPSVMVIIDLIIGLREYKHNKDRKILLGIIFCIIYISIFIITAIISYLSMLTKISI